MNTATARITRGAIALLSVFGLFLGATTTATAAKPPPIEKVAICQYNLSTSAWELVLVKTSVATKLATKGVAAYPGDPVPGMADYEFDAACVPQPVTPPETIFAVAYTDRDTTDGDSYNAAVDVVIAKIVDGNGTSVLDVGDKVITDQYPTSFAADAFGSFGVKEHVVSKVQSASYSDIVKVHSVVVWGEMVDPFTYAAFQFTNGAYHEFYQDRYSTSAPYDSSWLDNAASSYVDEVFVQTVSPSQPQADVNLSRENYTEDAFLDVDYVYDPTKVVIG